MTAVDSNVRHLFLKPGRERSVRNRHPWVFTGAIARGEGPTDAALAVVHDSDGAVIGSGFFSPNSQISARVIAHGEAVLTQELFRARLERAIAAREDVFDEQTTAARLVHAEGDDLSGLIVDRYNDLLVIEITSAGLEKWREWLVETLREMTGTRGVFIKNNVPARRIEGLEMNDRWLGDGEPTTTVLENGLTFAIAPTGAQKTGFFLDQRDNRWAVGALAAGRRVLNLFAYSGAFGVYAAAGGAESVLEVDISAPALEHARENHRLNDSSNVEYEAADAFDYARQLVREQRDFDLIVCDPPAFAKHKSDVDRAARGYKDINLQVFKLATPGAMVATFSCSGHMSLDLFQKVVYSAALDAGRSVSFVDRLTAGSDHPVSIYCPEGEYLKGLLLRVNE